MRRLIFTFIMTILSISSGYSETKFQDKEIPEINLDTRELEGKAKAGLALGYPTGLTFGYRPANYLEVNAFAGTHGKDFTLGGSLLFTLVEIKIAQEMFPLSAGPAVYTSFSSDFSLMTGACVRWEYTFQDVPLNLYIQAVPGIIFISDFQFALKSSFAVRYVF